MAINGKQHAQSNEPKQIAMRKLDNATPNIHSGIGHARKWTGIWQAGSIDVVTRICRIDIEKNVH